jgi:hypothetical protein
MTIWRQNIMPPKQHKLPIVTFDANGEMHIHTQNEEVRQMILDMRDSDDALELFCKFFLKSSFKKPFTAQRRNFAQNISNPDLPYIWGMASRSFGKTTLLWAELIRRLCFRLSPFILYCSSELRLAERRTESVRIALMSNPRIREFFGYLAPKYIEGMREVFGLKAWKLADPITGESYAVVVPKSDGTVVNGLVEYIEGEQQRPSFILCDDITDRKRVNDETYRSQHTDWLWGTLFPCVENEVQPDAQTHRWGIERGKRSPWQIAIIDTCKHSGAAIEVAAQQPDWTGERYALAKQVDPNGEVFVSMVDYLTDEQIMEIYLRHKRIGKEDTFFREYVCRAGAANDSKFPTIFQYYKEKDRDLNAPSDLTRFIIVDPARSQNARSDFTAMLAVAVDIYAAKIYLRGMIHERLAFEDIGMRLCSFAEQMNTRILAVEDAGLNDAIRGPLEKFADKRGLNPYWIWLPAGRKYIDADGERRTIKEARASAALWLYRPFEPTHPDGHVWHEESLRSGPLEAQQLSFPYNERDDALDTLGYVDYVIRELGLHFNKQVEQKADQQQSSDWDEWDDLLQNDVPITSRLCA